MNLLHRHGRDAPPVVVSPHDGIIAQRHLRA
jgi:hypothetical protein